jgi:hypothetical protein
LWFHEKTPLYIERGTRPPGAAYNLTRVMNIAGIKPLLAAIRA